MTFSNNLLKNETPPLKEKVLKQKLANLDTGGVGTSTKIENKVIYDPNKPLFELKEGFSTLDQVDSKFLQDYLQLVEQVPFTEKDEKKFSLFYSNFRRQEINCEDPKSLNKFGKFDLTNEIKERKKKEWWAKQKFKLLKLVNEKYSLVAGEMKPKIAKDQTKDKYFKLLSNSRNTIKITQSTGTDPDIL